MGAVCVRVRSTARTWARTGRGGQTGRGEGGGGRPTGSPSNCDCVTDSFLRVVRVRAWLWRQSAPVGCAMGDGRARKRMEVEGASEGNRPESSSWAALSSLIFPCFARRVPRCTSRGRSSHPHMTSMTARCAQPTRCWTMSNAPRARAAVFSCGGAAPPAPSGARSTFPSSRSPPNPHAHANNAQACHTRTSVWPGGTVSGVMERKREREATCTRARVRPSVGSDRWPPFPSSRSHSRRRCRPATAAHTGTVPMPRITPLKHSPHVHTQKKNTQRPAPGAGPGPRRARVAATHRSVALAAVLPLHCVLRRHDGREFEVNERSWCVCVARLSWKGALRGGSPLEFRVPALQRAPSPAHMSHHPPPSHTLKTHTRTQRARP